MVDKEKKLNRISSLVGPDRVRNRPHPAFCIQTDWKLEYH